MNERVRIYRPVPPDGFEWALPVHASDFERLQTLGVEPTHGHWRALKVHLLKVDDRGRVQRRASMPWLGSHVLVLRDEAIDAVGPLLERFGEVLPLLSADARVAVFGARALAGALDEQASDVVRFEGGGIMDLRRPVLRAEVVAKAGAFKLAEMPRGDVHLTQELVDAIRATGHSQGAEFKLVYDSGNAA